MRVSAPVTIAVRPGAKPRAGTAPCIEKSSGSRGLGGEPRPAPQKPQGAIPRLQVELVCQDDTRGVDPFWDAPRLKPAFVAQLLGQVMPGSDETLVRADAYGDAARRLAENTALLVDRKS